MPHLEKCGRAYKRRKSTQQEKKTCMCAGDFCHMDVIFVINFTDIDDKIITRAKEEGVSPQELARLWEREFCESVMQ